MVDDPDLKIGSLINMVYDTMFDQEVPIYTFYPVHAL